VAIISLGTSRPRTACAKRIADARGHSAKASGRDYEAVPKVAQEVGVSFPRIHAGALRKVHLVRVFEDLGSMCMNTELVVSLHGPVIELMPCREVRSRVLPDGGLEDPTASLQSLRRRQKGPEDRGVSKGLLFVHPNLITRSLDIRGFEGRPLDAHFETCGRSSPATRGGAAPPGLDSSARLR
jgi:hypothetical protein